MRAFCAGQAQISHEKQAASVSARELEKKISLSTIAYQGLEESLHQAEAAKLEAQDKGAELLRETARTAAEMSEVRLAMATALEESRAEKHNREALQADLAVLREKYSALKRRFVDAGKKVRMHNSSSPWRGECRRSTIRRSGSLWRRVSVSYQVV